jgi:hypothetical protein
MWQYTGARENHEIVRDGRDETVVTIWMQRMKYAQERNDGTGPGGKKKYKMLRTQ